MLKENGVFPSYHPQGNAIDKKQTFVQDTWLRKNVGLTIGFVKQGLKFILCKYNRIIKLLDTLHDKKKSFHSEFSNRMRASAVTVSAWHTIRGKIQKTIPYEFCPKLSILDRPDTNDLVSFPQHRLCE